MNSNAPHILLVNPWIHDFAAYDFWAKPLGLLLLGGILREHGARISYLDCLNRFHPLSATGSGPSSRCGRGPYRKTNIAKPPGLESIPRNYCRYGIPPDWFLADLKKLGTPDVVLVTSLMTYWYPGVREAIETVKSVFPYVPVVLGGIYATLCADHAKRTSGADEIVTGAGEKALFPLFSRLLGWSPEPAVDLEELDALPYPVLDLEHHLAHVPILTSLGCPFQCTYCASHFLQPRMLRRNPHLVAEEIRYWHDRYEVSDFAFYDDALLIDSDQQIAPLLERVIELNLQVRFHTPNALHIREITRPLAKMMRQAGFHTLRLGLETTAFRSRSEMDRKVTEREFSRAVRDLLAAGFDPDQLGAYLLAGLPGQEVEEIENSIGVVKQAGIKPVIAHYTPIPHTPLWEAAVASSRYDLETDPIFTNNAIFPCRSEAFSWEMLTRLKKMANA
jgi:radical SAM superfamily enzyme YgiQ (UPF0313 family)